MIRLPHAPVLLYLLASVAPAEDQAAPVKKFSVSAAGVKLVKPKGFEPAERFHGFRDLGRRSSVMVMNIPGPFAEVTKGLTTQGLASRGMKLLSTRKLKIGGADALLLSVSQVIAAPEKTEYRKWMLVFGDGKRTSMVTAAFPASFADELSEPLKACVLSAERIAVGGSDPDFTIQPAGKMKRGKHIGGALKALAFGLRAEGKGKPGEPMLIAMRSFLRDPIGKQREFALKRLHQTPQFEKIVKVLWTRPIEVDGLAGFESLADSTHTEPDLPMKVYQVMLFTDTGYILIRGSVRKEQGEEFLPVFQKMARSLKRTKK
jgi:hypothetical protein